MLEIISESYLSIILAISMPCYKYLILQYINLGSILWRIFLLHIKKIKTLDIKAFAVMHFIVAGELLSCYAENFDLSLKLLAVNTQC